MGSPCFAAETLVHTQEGLKPVEAIRAGDWLLSFPDDQVPPLRFREVHEYTYRQVTQIFVHDDNTVCEVEILDLGNGKMEKLKVTSDQRFFVKRSGWMPARDLNYQSVLYLENFGNVVVGCVENHKEICRVYSFEVEEFCTYYVGEMGVWVHSA